MTTAVFENVQDGCTVDQNLNLVQKAKGYFVALTDNRVTDAIESEIQKLRSMADMLRLSNVYFGYWRDERTGDRYLDLSVHIDRKDVAIELAKIHSQKAIFDCENIDVVYVQ